MDKISLNIIKIKLVLSEVVQLAIINLEKVVQKNKLDMFHNIKEITRIVKIKRNKNNKIKNLNNNSYYNKKRDNKVFLNKNMKHLIKLKLIMYKNNNRKKKNLKNKKKKYKNKNLKNRRKEYKNKNQSKILQILHNLILI